MGARSFIRCAARALVAAVVLDVGPVFAQSESELLASNCFACHGPRGMSWTDIPKLSGLSKDKIVDSFKKFRADALPATIMNRIARGYTDEQVEAIATYIEKLNKAK